MSAAFLVCFDCCWTDVYYYIMIIIVMLLCLVLWFSAVKTSSDEICLHLGSEISKISDCMPFLEIFPCPFGESTPSTVVPNHWRISLSYYSTVNILLFHFPSLAILVICQPGVTTVNLSRSLSLN